MAKRTREVNANGIGYKGIDDERIRDIRVYDEGGRVIIQFEAINCPCDPLQYLTPEEAMSFAKAFERCAIAALKESA